MKTSSISYPTVHLDVMLEDTSAVKTILALLKQLKGVHSVKAGKVEESKVQMTEKEFYAKLDKSIASSDESTMMVMVTEESGAQFINRMLANAQ